jgi:hemoglobin
MFARWLVLFGETCNEVFEPDVANAFQARAQRIAASFQAGLFALRPAS